MAAKAGDRWEAVPTRIHDRGRRLLHPLSSRASLSSYDATPSAMTPTGPGARCVGCIDDGGWASVAPLTDCFIVAPGDSFIREQERGLVSWYDRVPKSACQEMFGLNDQASVRRRIDAPGG